MSIDQTLASPIFWGFIALVSLAIGLLSIDYRAATGVLLAAWLFSGVALYRWQPILELTLTRRLLTVLFGMAIVGFCLERLGTWRDKHPVNEVTARVEAPAAVPSDPRIDQVLQQLDVLQRSKPRLPRPPSISLGGSLTRGRMSDGLMIQTSPWIDVADHRDATIDWDEADGFRAAAELVVRATGNAQIGLFDVTAGRLAVVTDTPLPLPAKAAGYVESTDKALPDSINVILDVPPATGLHTYRLVFRRVEGSNATVWASGDILFRRITATAGVVAPPTKVRVGSDGGELVELANDNAWVAAAGVFDITVNWAEGDFVGGRLDLGVKVVSPRGEPWSSVRARLRDTQSGQIYAGFEAVAAPTHGGMGWLMRGAPDVLPTTGSISIQVVRAADVQHLRLELSASKGGVKATASGVLSLFIR